MGRGQLTQGPGSHGGGAGIALTLNEIGWETTKGV